MREHTGKYTDFLVRIDINKDIESLNISNSAAIVFHHLAIQKKCLSKCYLYFLYDIIQFSQGIFFVKSIQRIKTILCFINGVIIIT